MVSTYKATVFSSVCFCYIYLLKLFILQFLLWTSVGRNSDKAVGTRRLAMLRFSEHSALRHAAKQLAVWLEWVMTCYSTV